MQVLELTRAGSSMEFEIFHGSEKIGTMVVGRGTLTWYGKSRRTGKTLSWTRFAKLMDEQAYE
jgi:hypothetical protein